MSNRAGNKTRPTNRLDKDSTQVEIKKRNWTTNNLKISPKKPWNPERSHNSLQTALISPPKNINGKKKAEDGSHNQKIVKTISKENSRENSWRKTQREFCT